MIRVLVQNQSNAALNGVYYVSNVGSISTNWELTRNNRRGRILSKVTKVLVKGLTSTYRMVIL